ncbi:hypothetical protein M3Y98_00971300 [Aphelenchoides besseyi]|nr:hypothetical protein M3Y98_00971300 [Aphelenchoides besseyi]
MGSTEDLDDDAANTISLTICLDEDDTKYDQVSNSGVSFFDMIDEPTTSGLCMNVDANILIADLPGPVLQVLQQRLNSPAVGTMRNWEYVAMCLGSSLDEIATLRSSPYATQSILRAYRNHSFNSLLLAIKDARRLDVLIALKPHLQNIRPLNKNERAVHLSNTRPLSPNMFDTNAINHTSTFDSTIDQLNIRSSRSQPILPPKRFILLTHHEVPGDKLKRKSYKTLFANLKKWGESSATDVVDINDCLDESDMHGVLKAHFHQARQIVLVASEAYEEVCHSKAETSDGRLRLKRFLHQFMEQEYLKEGRNLRFRVILLCSSDHKYIPLGWASNTLFYLFPEQRNEIGKIDVSKQNAAGDTPLHIAIELGYKVTVMLKHARSQAQESLSQRKPHLIKMLNEVDDFYLEFKWNFHSWVPLLSRMLPSDVCRIYKKGCALRMDTTLLNMSDKSWERGDVSFLFNPELPSDRQSVVLDNKRRTFLSTKIELEFETNRRRSRCYDVQNLNLITKKRREHLTAEDVKKNKSIMNMFSKGHVVDEEEMNWSKQRESLPPPTKQQISFEEYISSVDPVPLGREPLVKTNTKTYTAMVAMSKEFPLSVNLLVDALEVVAPVSRRINKLRNFIDRKLPPGFPVMLEFPLFATLSAQITFRKFEWRDDLTERMFIVPRSYTEDSVRRFNL